MSPLRIFQPIQQHCLSFCLARKPPQIPGPHDARSFVSTSRRTASIGALLGQPTWSVRSLSEGNPPTEDKSISAAQLHQLLRLSALSPPAKSEEGAMIGVLESQLRFVQHVQSIDTTGVEPLSSIRDDTAEGLREAAITLDQLKSALDDEISLGRVKRPRRVCRDPGFSAVEPWNPLGTARRTAGSYFVVRDSTG